MMFRRYLIVGLLCLSVVVQAGIAFAQEHKVFDGDTGKEISGKIKEDVLYDFYGYAGKEHELIYIYYFTEKEFYVNMNNATLLGSTGKEGKSAYDQAGLLKGTKKLLKKDFFEFRKKYFPEKNPISEERYQKLKDNFDIEKYAKNDKPSKKKRTPGAWITKSFPF